MDETGGSLRRHVFPRDIVGLKALEIQLPSSVVKIPSLQNAWNSATYALLYFNKNLYVFPEHRHNLVSHIIAADALGADHFLAYVGEKLSSINTI